MSAFSRNLDSLFEDGSGGINPVDAARDLRNELEAAKQEVTNIESQLKIVTQRMNGDLALGIRRQHPSLNVGVNRDGCKIGYKTKHLLINPDVEKGVWAVKSADPRFLSKFSKSFAPHTVLNQDIGDLIQSVLLHFTGHYKSLGEELIGNGIVLIEGKRSTLLGLAIWRDNKGGPHRPLKSRLARRQMST